MSVPSPGLLRRASSVSGGQLPSLSVADVILQASSPSSDKKVEPRDWKTVPVSEVVAGQNLVTIDGDTSLEDACQMLIDRDMTSIPVRLKDGEKGISHTFDFTDLNAFLLLVLGVGHPVEDAGSFQDLVMRARTGGKVPVARISDMAPKDPFVTVPSNEGLGKIVEIMGTGVHRLAVTDEAGELVGIVSQWSLVKYLWDNIRTFPALESLYQQTVEKLAIGSKETVSIHGDKRVLEAFETMNKLNISSLAVVDSQNNLIGNISITDVKYVTRASSAPLLRTTCSHFLGIIRYEQGVENGRDSFPVFSVNPGSSLGHTVAKLIATKSHRMWVTVSSSASSTPPLTSGLQTHVPAIQPHSIGGPAPPPPHTDRLASTASNAGAIPTSGAAVGSGILRGVVSLTDIIYCFAREGGMNVDPGEARRRRRSSSAYSSASGNGDAARDRFWAEVGSPGPRERRTSGLGGSAVE